MKIPELLAPAGSALAFKAAIAAGADAVYFGLDKFNARERADNITLQELPTLIDIAHNKNARAYMTLNTLVHDDELYSLVDLADKAITSGIDAVIVQDYGVLRVLRQCFPNLEIHASTQMTTHNVAQCRLFVKENVKQVNLSRELTFSEIKQITSYLANNNISTEVFVHGAYCISFSGQCYFSGCLYNLPGNRGQCVQPCRREWIQNTNSSSTPFNLKDNCAFSYVQNLIDCGANSLKIEGRIKSPEYVWAVTSAWREQLDRVKEGKTPLTTDERLNKAMNRGFSTGYLEGNISRSMFTSGIKDHSLEYVGEVENYHADAKLLTIIKTPKKDNIPQVGDNISIISKNNSFACTGIITECKQQKDNQYECLFTMTGKMNNHIEKNMLVYRIPLLITKENLLSLIKQLEPSKKQLSVYVTGKFGEQLISNFTCNDQTVTVYSKSVLQKAANKPLDELVLKEKFGRLGETNFTLNDVYTKDLADGLFIPLGELNEMRREAVTQLQKQVILTKNVSSEEKEQISKLVVENIVLQNSTITHAIEADPVYFCSDIKMALQKSNSGNLVIFEMPVVYNKNKEEIIQFLLDNQTIIPYFPAILFDDDLTVADDILSRLNSACTDTISADTVCAKNKARKIICSNTGLAFLASDKGFNVIPGMNLNIMNTQSVVELNNMFSFPAFISSPELTEEEALCLNYPYKVEMWLPPKDRKFLMQSRQCLVCKTSDNICPKEAITKDCLLTCSRKGVLVGKNKERILAIKRPGFYSALYMDSVEKKIYKPTSKIIEKQLNVSTQSKVFRRIIDLRVF